MNHTSRFELIHNFNVNLTKERSLFTLSHRGSEFSVLIILTNQIVTFMQLIAFQKLSSFGFGSTVTRKGINKIIQLSLSSKILHTSNKVHFPGIFIKKSK